MKKKSGDDDNAPLREDVEWVFHQGLQTWVFRISYDWLQGFGEIWARGPVDMSGSIRLFEKIDKGVEIIVAYLNDEPDTCYRKRNGKWEFGDMRKESRAHEPAHVNH